MLIITRKGLRLGSQLSDKIYETEGLPSKDDYSQFKVLMTLKELGGEVEDEEVLLQEMDDLWLSIIGNHMSAEEKTYSRKVIKSLFEARYIDRASS